MYRLQKENRSMFKRRIWILCVIVVLILMTKHFWESKPKADLAMKPDVVNSISINQDQYLTVVANRSKIEDKEEFADLLIQMYKENSFQTIKFSSDIRGMTSVNMRVYLQRKEIEGHEPVMIVQYGKGVGNLCTSERIIAIEY